MLTSLLDALWEHCLPEHWMNSGWKKDDDIQPWVQVRQSKVRFLTTLIPSQHKGTYKQVYNSQLLPESGLHPFRIDHDNHWTSTKARFLYEEKDVEPKCEFNLDLSVPNALMYGTLQTTPTMKSHG